MLPTLSMPAPCPLVKLYIDFQLKNIHTRIGLVWSLSFVYLLALELSRGVDLI
jgi:hypothetical protein